MTVLGLTTADNTPALTGTVSDPSATVQVTVNGTTYAATNNGDGTWTLADNTIAPALADGTYDVRSPRPMRWERRHRWLTQRTDGRHDRADRHGHRPDTADNTPH